MKTTQCRCGNRLFFFNFQCLSCGSVVGLCGSCHTTTSFSEQFDGKLVCDQAKCGAVCTPCENRQGSVCNGISPVDAGEICWCCEYTTVIPDLQDANNTRRWRRLERAKRRLLLQLESCGLPPFVDGISDPYPLSFEFKAPTVTEAGETIGVITGHADGVITINAEEADHERREATRVILREPQRTLIGHMRHEVGHYIDWAYAYRFDKDDYVKVFGDPLATDYGRAKDWYYENGPEVDWESKYVSAYASMHPWEDFAECTNVYLDILSIAETANDQGFPTIATGPEAKLDEVIHDTLRLAVVISEFNCDLGLPPLLPEKIPVPWLKS